MTIEEQNIFLHRKPKEFWTRKIKRHTLRDCKCGATQDEDNVVVIYCGSGDYGAVFDLCNEIYGKDFYRYE